jgi:hypothetical protein
LLLHADSADALVEALLDYWFPLQKTSSDAIVKRHEGGDPVCIHLWWTDSIFTRDWPRHLRRGFQDSTNRSRLLVKPRVFRIGQNPLKIKDQKF